MIIKNCIITKSDAEIVKDWYVVENEIHSGIDLAAKFTNVDVNKMNIYSPCYGVVVDILYTTEEKNVVVIQYSASICVRFANLTEVKVKKSALVKFGDLIGICSKFVHVEYLQLQTDTIKLPVQVLTMTYYKTDPTALVQGKLALGTSGVSNLTIVNFSTKIPAISNISYEFKDNR